MNLLLQFYVILFPGFAAAAVMCFLRRRKPSLREGITEVSGFGLFCFWLMNGVEYLRGWKDYEWWAFTPQFLVKYTVMTAVLAAALACLKSAADCPEGFMAGIRQIVRNSARAETGKEESGKPLQG